MWGRIAEDCKLSCESSRREHTRWHICIHDFPFRDVLQGQKWLRVQNGGIGSMSRLEVFTRGHHGVHILIIVQRRWARLGYQPVRRVRGSTKR